MAIKVHHGPPGSYKTSGSIADDLGIAVLEGRTIVTNVRGLTNRDRLIATFVEQAKKKRRIFFWLPKYPRLASALKRGNPYNCEIIHVPCEDEEGREKMRRWWHWAPAGAYLQLDEVQRLWPRNMAAKDVRALDITDPDDAVFPSGETRPITMANAFDMHRHGNWDIALTTPNITKIHADIIGASETAYKHFALETIGLPGFYREVFHVADTTGKSASDVLSYKIRRVPAWVFDCYESTATGQHSKSSAGLSLFASPKIVGMVLFAVLCIGYSVYGLATRESFAERSAKLSQPSGPPDRVVSGPYRPPRAALPAGAVASSHASDPGGLPDPQQGDAVVLPEPLSGWNVSLSGWAFDKPQFTLSRSGNKHTVMAVDIEALGYEIQRVGDCIVRLTHGRHQRLAMGCSPRDDTRPGIPAQMMQAVAPLGG